MWKCIGQKFLEMSSQFVERNLTSICKFSHWHYQTLLTVDFSFWNFYSKNLSQISFIAQHKPFLFTLGSLFLVAEWGIGVKLIQVLFEGRTSCIVYICFANYVYERNTSIDYCIIIRVCPPEHFDHEAISRLFRAKSEKCIKGTIRPIEIEGLSIHWKEVPWLLLLTL